MARSEAPTCCTEASATDCCSLSAVGCRWGSARRGLRTDEAGLDAGLKDRGAEGPSKKGGGALCPCPAAWPCCSCARESRSAGIDLALGGALSRACRAVSPISWGELREAACIVDVCAYITKGRAGEEMDRGSGAVWGAGWVLCAEKNGSVGRAGLVPTSLIVAESGCRAAVWAGLMVQEGRECSTSLMAG